jgi:FkbM family methyltransferase
LERPELLAAVYPTARQALHEEIAISAVLASSLRSDEMYVDVGTNRGQVLREAVRVAPDGGMSFLSRFSLAAEIARTFPQVDSRQIALGAVAVTEQFCHFRTLDGWSGLRRSPDISDEHGDPEYITVQVSTLDAEIAELRPGVIKIDVEGAELDVLEGARSLLSDVKPVVIFEHVATVAALYGSPPAACWDLLVELDYRVFAVTGSGPFSRADFAQNVSVVNWLATPRVSSPSR